MMEVQDQINYHMSLRFAASQNQQPIIWVPNQNSLMMPIWFLVGYKKQYTVNFELVCRSLEVASLIVTETIPSSLYRVVQTISENLH
jgi:hypothetical protein